MNVSMSTNVNSEVWFGSTGNRIVIRPDRIGRSPWIRACHKPQCRLTRYVPKNLGGRMPPLQDGSVAIAADLADSRSPAPMVPAELAAGRPVRPGTTPTVTPPTLGMPRHRAWSVSALSWTKIGRTRARMTDGDQATLFRACFSCPVSDRTALQSWLSGERRWLALRDTERPAVDSASTQQGISLELVLTFLRYMRTLLQ